MYRYCILFFILLLFIFSPHSQDRKGKLQYEKLYHNAENLYSLNAATATTDSIALATYRQVINLLSKEKNYNEILTDSYLKCGILSMSGNAYEEALGYFHMAVKTAKQGYHLSDTLLFKPYLYIGSIYYSLNNLDSAVFYYTSADAISNKYAALNESERLYNKFGALYYETGDYKKSILYFKKALSIVEAGKPVNIFFIVNYSNNIAAALLKLQDYKSAIKIFNTLLPYHIAEDELYYNMGNTYIEAGNYEEGLKFLRRIGQMDQEKFNGMTNVFMQLKQYDSAQFYLTKAKNTIFKEKKFTSKINYGVTLKYSGDLKVVAGKTLAAIQDYQHSIINLNPAFTDTTVTSNPSSFLGLQNFALLFDVLVAKGAAFGNIKNQHPNQHYLLQSLNAYASALSLAKHVERTYSSDDAKLFLKNKVNPATQQAVDIAIRLYNQSKKLQYMHIAFSFIENNKASVLQAGLQNLQLSVIAGVPAVMVAEEKKYKSLLAKLVIQSANTNDSIAFALLQQNIQQAAMALNAVQNKLDKNPVYHQLKFNSSLVSMDRLQQKATAKDEAILCYYYTADNLFCFYITSAESGFSSVPLKDNFFSSIILLRKQLESPEASSRKMMQDAGAVLFQQLIFPVAEKIKNKKHLVIIPYNEISYVPFEMMPDTDGSLLLNKFAVSYNYSVNFIADKKTASVMKYDVLAMAPFSEKNNTNAVLPSLPSSAEEINDLPGKKLIAQQAVKSEFMVLCNNYPVVHLATHAVVNDTNALGSYIEFYGVKNDADTSHRLYEPEIYNLDMKNAGLVILSACETGNGLLVNGEGVISLSRAFSYAGCKSVITSLWKADDMATAFIIKRLHIYLQKGLAKDEALQKAKIDYLKSHDIEDRFKTPAYWAHLVLIGDHQALVASGFNWYLPLLSILITGLLIFLFYKKTARQN